MKKIKIGATSLAAIGCAVGLNVLNPLQEVENKRFSLQSDLNYIEYHAFNTVTSSAVVQKEDSILNRPKEDNILLLNDIKQKVNIKEATKMYVTTNVNVRTGADLKSDVITVLKRGKAVKVFEKLNNGWTKVLYKNKIAYICSKYLSKKKPKKEVEILGNYIEYTAPSGHHPKSYMDWDCITSPSSKQYKLKQSCYIGNYGVIMHQDRYCVALGSGFIKTGVGTKFDLILANGTVIKCIAGDMKADAHTDSTNRITSHDGSIAEFIVNTSSMVSNARRMGDVSYSCDAWNSEIAKIRVYQ